MCFAPQRRALFRHLNLQKWREHMVFCSFWLRNVLRATMACTFPTSQLPKVVRQWCVLYILTSKCASRHNGVHFFNISTSKSGPRMVCFVHFHFQMCFAPQRRALFQHLNFQKWSENGVLYLFTSKSASRHNGVQFFISHLASWFRTRRFSESTFRPSGATNHWKNTVFRDFPTFAHLHLLSSDSFSSTLLSSNLSLLSASALLCFSSVHIVGSLTSKLPSIISMHSKHLSLHIFMATADPRNPRSGALALGVEKGSRIQPHPYHRTSRNTFLAVLDSHWCWWHFRTEYVCNI